MFSYEIDDQTSLKMLDLRDTEHLFALTIQSRDTLREWFHLLILRVLLKTLEDFIQSTMKQFSDNNGFQAGIWYDGNLAGVIGFP